MFKSLSFWKNDVLSTFLLFQFCVPFVGLATNRNAERGSVAYQKLLTPWWTLSKIQHIWNSRSTAFSYWRRTSITVKIFWEWVGYSCLCLSTHSSSGSLPWVCRSQKLVEHRLISTLITYLRIIVEEQGVAHSNDDFKADSSLSSCSPTSSGHMSPVSESESSNSFSGSPQSEGFPTSPALSMDSVYSPVCSPSMDGFDEDNSEDESEKLSVGDSSRADSPLTLQVSHRSTDQRK